MVSLQTTDSFKQQPTHPVNLPPTLIQNILSKITKRQEQGIFQDFIMGSSTDVPLFSSSQIQFLGPQLALALSKATNEELVVFKSSPGDDPKSLISGTVAVFSPSTLFVTVMKDPRSIAKTQKQTNPSGYFHGYHVLGFSEKAGILSQEQAESLMSIPSSSGWVAIDMAHFKTLAPQRSDPQSPVSVPPLGSTPRHPPGQKSQTFYEQLEDLRKKLEEQDQEIQRLKQRPVE